jgi:hypothetical protein
MTPVNCTSSELSTFLRALEADCLQTSCSGTDPFVPSRFESPVNESCSNAWPMGASPGSPYSRTRAPSTDAPGEGSSTSSTARFLASHSPVPLEADEWPLTSGPNSGASSRSAGPDTSWQKTSNVNPSSAQPGNFTLTAIKLPFARYRQPTWVPHIEDSVGGSWLPTPTETANYDAPSMRKQWPAHRRLRLWTGGRTTPRHIEFLMGWPLGWSDSAPLEMESFRLWKKRHGNSCAPSLTKSERDDGARRSAARC